MILSKVLNLFLKHKELATFTLLTYIDKLIAFCLPIAVLYLTKNQEEYNNIEYVFSIANIAIVLLEVGVRNYFFYGYSIANNRELFVKQVKGYFSTLFNIYVIVGLFLLPVIYFSVDETIYYIIVFIAVRSLFLLLTGFYNSYYRLIDRPSLVFWLTIPVNLLSVLLIFFVSLTKLSGVLFAFFIPQSLLIIMGFFIIKNSLSTTKIKDLFSYIKIALKYSWPIIINILLITYINNFAKIYAYNRMTSDDMYQLSYTLRVALIIQMMHAAISGYYSKRIFIDKSLKINRRILTLYSCFLGISVVFVLIFILLINQLDSIDSLNINFTTIIIIAYTVLWCYQAYLELYLSKFKKTKLILLFSAISALFYFISIYFSRIESIQTLALIMLGAMLLNFLLTIGYLKSQYVTKM